MMKNIFFLLISGVFSAQVGINTNIPEPSSILDIKTNGTHKSVTIPKVNLLSYTDKTTINGGNPAHGLLVYNTNNTLNEGKGMYWWDNNAGKWIAIVNQQSRSYYANLSRYYITSSTNTVEMRNKTFYDEEQYNIGDNLDTTWTLIPDLTMNITVDKPVNSARIAFTAGVGTSRDYNSSYPLKPLQDLSIGYAIFIDDKLVAARAQDMIIRNYCGLHYFYINGVADNLSVGNHTVKFAVKKRSNINNDAGYHETNGYNIGGPAYYYNGSTTINCTNINTFEGRPNATLYLTQKP